MAVSGLGPSTLMVVWALLLAGAPGKILQPRYGDWRAPAAPLVFQGTELYTFMDGGAEIYFEYGFERLESQSYSRQADEIAVELYRMTGNAYGIFTFLRPRHCETPEVGDAACLADHYLLFAKGPYLCAVTAQSAFLGGPEALLQIAIPVAAQLEGAAMAPEVLSLLPADGAQAPKREIRGPVGLRSVSQQAGRLFDGFRSGATTEFPAGVTGGVLVWSDDSRASEAWDRAADRARRAGRPVGTDPSGGLGWCDESGCLGAERLDSAVIFASGTDLTEVNQRLARLTANVVHDRTRADEEVAR